MSSTASLILSGVKCKRDWNVGPKAHCGATEARKTPETWKARRSCLNFSDMNDLPIKKPPEKTSDGSYEIQTTPEQ